MVYPQATLPQGISARATRLCTHRAFNGVLLPSLQNVVLQVFGEPLGGCISTVSIENTEVGVWQPTLVRGIHLPEVRRDISETTLASGVRVPSTVRLGSISRTCKKAACCPQLEIAARSTATPPVRTSKRKKRARPATNSSALHRLFTYYRLYSHASHIHNISSR